MSEQNNKLPSSITITVDGQQREIFMSFALLNRVCYLMGDAAHIPAILQDPELREAVLKVALAERSPTGKVLKEVDVDELNVSFVDIQSVLEFISEHVVDFTVAAVARAQQVMAKNQGRIDALKLSSTATQTGSAN